MEIKKILNKMQIKNIPKDIIYIAIFFYCISALTTINVFEFDSISYFSRIEALNNLFKNGNLYVPAMPNLIKTGDAVMGADGKLYWLTPPGQYIITIPFFLLGKGAFSFANVFFHPIKERVFLSILLTLTFYNVLPVIIAICLYRFSRELGYNKKISLLSTLLYYFCTIQWSQVTTTHEDMPIALCFLLLLRLLTKWHSQPAPNITLGIISICTLTVLLKPFYIWMFLLLWWMFFRNKNFLQKKKFFALSLVAILCVTLIYGIHNYIRFGDIFETGLRIMFRGFQKDYPNLRGTGINTGINSSFNQILQTFINMLFSWRKGLFVFNPIILLSILYFPPFFKKNRTTALIIIIFIICLLLTWSFSPTWGGDWCWGGRYLLPVIILLIMPINELLNSWSKLKYLSKIICSGIILLGLFIQILSILLPFYYESKLFSDEPFFHMVGAQMKNNCLYYDSSIPIIWLRLKAILTQTSLYDFSIWWIKIFFNPFLICVFSLLLICTLWSAYNIYKMLNN